MNRSALRNSAKVSLCFDLVVIVGIVCSAWTLWWLPEQLRDTVWATSARAGLATLLLIPALSIASLFWRPTPRPFASTPAIVTRSHALPAARKRRR
jgi:hypothetical protein